MSKLVFVVLALALLGAANAEAQRVTIPRCNVGADPVNRDRQPTVNEEIVTNPADQVITMKSGNGSTITCNLQAGAPVAADKKTGVVVWVYGCGNDVLTYWIIKRPPASPFVASKTTNADTTIRRARVDVYHHFDLLRVSGEVTTTPSPQPITYTE